MGLEKDYWKYYTRVPYKSPISKTVKDEKGNEHTEYKCCFPIKLIDWEEYNEIAFPILSISPTLLTRRLQLNLEEVSVFDYVIVCLLQEDKVENMEKMFSMAFGEEIKAMVFKHDGELEVRFVFSSDNDFYIDKDNYLAVREIMMAQSFYFDPIVGKNERAQKAIDNAIKRLARTKSGTPMNMESQIALIRSEFGERDWLNYTYYEMRVDFYTIMRKENYRSVHVYRVLGNDIKIPELGAVSEVHDNPLGEDVLFKKNDRNKDKY